MVDPFIAVVTLLISSWLVNGLLDVRVTVNVVECNPLNCRAVVLKAPVRAIILSRVIARLGMETVQCMKEPDILSQVNRTCPPGQTDTIPTGDSVMDAPIRFN